MYNLSGNFFSGFFNWFLDKNAFDGGCLPKSNTRLN